MFCGRLGIFKALFLAIPFYFLWNYFAPIYLTGAPEVYQAVPFMHVFGIFVLIGIARAVLFGVGRWGRHRWGHHAHFGGFRGWGHHGYGSHRFNHPGHRFDRSGHRFSRKW